jgi:hypothetical protein
MTYCFLIFFLNTVLKKCLLSLVCKRVWDITKSLSLPQPKRAECRCDKYLNVSLSVLPVTHPQMFLFRSLLLSFLWHWPPFRGKNFRAVLCVFLFFHSFVSPWVRVRGRWSCVAQFPLSYQCRNQPSQDQGDNPNRTKETVQPRSGGQLSQHQGYSPARTKGTAQLRPGWDLSQD